MPVLTSRPGSQGPRSPIRETADVLSTPMSSPNREQRYRDGAAVHGTARWNGDDHYYRGDQKAISAAHVTRASHELSTFNTATVDVSVPAPTPAPVTAAGTTTALEPKLLGRILYRQKSRVEDKDKHSLPQGSKTAVQHDELPLTEDAQHWSEVSAVQQQSDPPAAARRAASNLQTAPKSPQRAGTIVTSPVMHTLSPIAAASASQPLKKKTSLLDRLRSRPSPAPTPAPIEMVKPRAPYVPKHAASDFLRLGQGSAQPSSDESEGRTLTTRHEPMETVVEMPTVDEYPDPTKQRLLSQPMQTLMENEATPTRGEVSRKAPIFSDEGNVSESARQHAGAPRSSEAKVAAKMRPQSAGKRGSVHSQSQLQPQPQSQPQSQSYSYRVVADREIPRSAALVENDLRKSLPPVPATSSLPSGLNGSREPSLRGSFRTSSDKISSRHVKKAEAQQPSDYELFLARAEAEERVLREELLHNFSQQYTANNNTHYTATTNSHVQPPAVRPPSYPSTSTTAVPSPAATSKESDIGSGNRSRRNSGPPNDTYRYHDERLLNKRFSAPPEKQQYEYVRERQRPVHIAELAMPGVDAGFAKSHPKTPQPGAAAKTLRRQSSITQRISEYIRPPREQPSHAELAAGASSRTAIRRYGTPGPRPQQAVATVVE